MIVYRGLNNRIAWGTRINSAEVVVYTVGTEQWKVALTFSQWGDQTCADLVDAL